MSNFRGTLIGWAVFIHGIEQQLKTKSLLWQSSRIFDAVKEIEFARMSSRDLVRLAELGKESRTGARWIPNDCENVLPKTEYDDEKEFIKAMKAEIRTVFYAVIDFEFYPHVNIDSDFSEIEFLFYTKRLQNALYDCDRILGLRFGEFTY